MIYSMTAFARAQNQSEKGNLVCEIRSINHRYLEVGVYVQEALRVLEMPIRERMRQFLKRGKIECTIRYQAGTHANTTLFNIDIMLAKELCQASEKMSKMLETPGPINPMDILRFPGVLEPQSTDVEALRKEVMLLIDKTLKDLVEARAREGEKLKALFLERMDLMRVELNKVRERLPQVSKEQHNRLLKRFADAKVELDPGRLEQEMVIFAHKIDIAEEIDRTETHIAEVRRILDQGGAVGRRLDFLLQELNREANTLGSKSVDSVVTHAAVEMKVLIEQVREQVQNVE